MATIDQLGWRISEDQFEPQSPNMFWPADRAWFVATDIGLDSTIEAGSQSLVDTVLTTPSLDARPLDPGDSLAFDGNMVNL